MESFFFHVILTMFKKSPFKNEKRATDIPQNGVKKKTQRTAARIQSPRDVQLSVLTFLKSLTFLHYTLAARSVCVVY